MKKLLDKYYILPYFLLIFSFAFPNRIISIVSFLFVLTWIISEFFFRFSLILSDKRKKIVLLVLILFYLLHFIGIIYSSNKPSGWFDLEVKFSLFIFPLIFIVSYNRVKEFRTQLLSFFIVGILLMSLFLLANALFHSISFSKTSGFVFNSRIPVEQADTNTMAPNFFHYVGLSAFKHPSYLAMYINVCIITIFYFINKGTNPFISIIKTRINFIWFVLIIFFSIMIYLLSSRTNIIAYFIIVPVCLFWISKRKLLLLPVFLVILIISLLVIKHNSRFYYSIHEVKNSSELIQLAKESKYQEIFSRFGIYRLPILLSSIDIIKMNPVIGVGTGDVKDALMQQYKKSNMQIFSEHNLNAHNQFLETLIGLGIIGLVILLAVFLIPLIYSIIYKDYLLLLFIICTIINFANESMLNTISGVVFFAFMYSFLVAGLSKKSSVE